MTTMEPRFWGSWKGRVVKAITVNDARTWDEIRDLTGLSPMSLNRALYELFELGVLEKMSSGTYKVGHDIGKEYKSFFERNEEPGESLKAPAKMKFSEEKQKELVDWIAQWGELKDLTFPLEPKHFFLEGRYLDDLSKELICRAKSEALVVNPFVNKCDLSDTLREASKNGVEVKLITRPPDIERVQFQQDKEEYHGLLKGDGVKVTYNKAVHAKLITVDRAVAILSSMNFYSGSSGGASWEAGLVSIEKTVVESIADSILGLLEKPESKEFV
jgi:hypothetical protein